MKNIETYDFKNKKVLIRVDFNIPLDHEYEIVNDLRIKTTLPTIYKVILNGGSAILLSHLGRPKGEYDVNLSLKHLIKHLEKIFNKTIKFSSNCIGPEAIEKAKNLKSGEILLLENVRFHKEELTADENFAKALSLLGDVYINDAFGASHRNHASLTIITKYFKDRMMGYIMKKEVENVNEVIKNPKKKFTLVLGGAKISDKVEFIEGLLKNIDNLLIGGALAHLFLKAKGSNIGSSYFEKDNIHLASKIIKKSKINNINLLLPSDLYIAERFHKDSEKYITASNKIRPGWMGVDIGPQTQQIYGEILKNSKTILWNGPVGVYEIPSFREGTRAIAKNISYATKNKAFSLIGGGDTAAAIYLLNFENEMSYISTGGGALLFFISKNYLPALNSLKGIYTNI